MSRDRNILGDDDRASNKTLERMLRRIRSTDEFPSISRYLVEINEKLSSNPEASDATELANVILKDYALTNKLLKLVNSAFYGLASGKVSTITRAVVVLGYEHIRLATISLALFEHFRNKSSAVDLKEAVVGSFWSGVLARDIAGLEKGIDPEEAFVCAMMSQLGKLVMICYLPDEYHKVTQRMAQTGENEGKALKEACGISYEKLGIAVARQWNFPDQICDSMRRLSDKELDNKGNLPEKLRVLSNMVRELSNKIQKGRLVSDPVLQNLLDRHCSMIKLSRNQLKTLVKDSLGKVQQHAQALDFYVENSAFIQNLTTVVYPGRAKAGDADAKASKISMIDGFLLTDGSDLRGNEGQYAIQTPMNIILEGIQEISEAMLSEYEINDVALMSLEICYRAVRFNRALMFIREGQGQTMSARFGYGHQCLQLTKKVKFDLSGGNDLFSRSVQSGKDLIVADTNNAQTKHMVPEWYFSLVDAPAFIFLPVMIQKLCIGAFYGDRKVCGQPISDQEYRHLCLLRNQLVLAIKYQRGPARH